MTARILGTLATVLFLAFAAAQEVDQKKDDRRQRREEQEDYFAKWVREDVTYIISPEERSVFGKLTTDDERNQFIEQFWLRRDPDVRTASNEFKDEHYRRIAYANERYTSGTAGWKTDRGRIYIIHGPPVEIEKHRTGESYQRPMHEGGGFTTVYAFEVWRYRYIPGMGTNVELEFVDPSGSGEFRLALYPWEKDAELFNITAGQTIAEEIGVATRADHPYFKPYTADTYVGMGGRMVDNPFIRYERLIKAQRPREIKFKDLKALVNVQVGYDVLPFDLRVDYFRLNDHQILAPMTVQVDNKNLGFRLEHGNHVARVAVYGLVTSMTNRVVAEFDHELLISFTPEKFEAGLAGQSLFQKVVPVEDKMRYKISFVVKDLGLGKVGVEQKAIIPPPYSVKKLTLSSLLISDHIVGLEDVPTETEMFVIGDVKVRPNANDVFDAGNPMGLYLHVYNVELDQTSSSPSLRVSYKLFKGQERVWEDTDAAGESIQFFSSRRVVLIKNIPGETLSPARYRLQVDIQDRVGGAQTSASRSFTVKGE